MIDAYNGWIRSGKNFTAKSEISQLTKNVEIPLTLPPVRATK
jgi:hypothetical protein